MILNEVLSNGVILAREYGEVCELGVWHFAYNDGGRVVLFRGSEGGLEESFGYWLDRFGRSDVPLKLEDADGNVWERRWYPLKWS